ncbi:MAG: beta-galactosidase trimerization domain-containing protein [Acidobacteria bacterium]|nr:beta-galactosidase trimerization domain-containing protein [Acidobacteriota bacterium]
MKRLARPPAPPLPARRDFLKTSALAGVAQGLGRLAWPASGPAPAATADEVPPLPSWTFRPMRWAQLTLVEDDPPGLDAGFWLDYFQRTHSDAVCLSAGGCVAYYPTEVPFHHRSAWLGDRDVFGELAAGCRRLGMVVAARTDPHATYDDVQAAHPDWIAVDEEGRPRRHWASPEMWVTCGLGPYNFEFMTEVMREIMARYRVDALFVNRWDGSGPCYCEHCRTGFRAATGRDLPRTADPGDPVHRDYRQWREERLFALWRLWDSEVRKINADSCVIPNAGGGASSRLDMKTIGERAPMLAADRQARRGLMAPWAIGMNAKEYRATMGQKPVVGIFSVGVEEPYRWKDSVQSGDEIRLWVADLVANGMRPWFTKFAGTLHDERWLRPVEELYTWCHGAERYLRNERPLARVGLVYSQQTAWSCAGDRVRQRVEEPALGWYQALVESRIPFEMVHDRLLDAPHLAPLETLILPNIEALSDRQCAQLSDFVTRGGGLVATSETSLRDEDGIERSDFGLADLLGVSFVGRRPGPVRNSYLRLEHDSAAGHPLLQGLEDAPRIINGVWQLDVKANVPFPNPPLTLIPSYPDLPMEKVYVRQPRTGIPQVFLREVGAGRVAYFPWDVDRTFWEVLSPDHLKLLRNAVTWATNEDPPVSVVGPGVLDVTVWRQRDSLTVHLVNLTNPMMMKGPVRELLPVAEQRVRVRLPDGLRATRLELLVGVQAPPVRQTGEWLEVTVPSIHAHEVIAVDLAASRD